MQFICNKLSFLPLAENSQMAEQRFSNLMEAFKSAKEKYNFTHVCFPTTYSTQMITATQNFFEWISSVTNHTLKNLILALCRRPFMDDLTEQELEVFYQSEYEIIDPGVPVNDSPIGLPIAYIRSTPAISLHSHDFWLKRTINMRKPNVAGEDATFFAYNICRANDITSNELIEWADNCMSLLIDSEDKVRRYLGFQKFQLQFNGDFLNELLAWKDDNVELYKYTLLLMKDVELHPFTGGMGQTENLRHRGKEASKRITIGDRLSYSIENNIVTFISCKGHYEFH